MGHEAATLGEVPPWYAPSRRRILRRQRGVLQRSSLFTSSTGSLAHPELPSACHDEGLGLEPIQGSGGRISSWSGRLRRTSPALLDYSGIR